MCLTLARRSFPHLPDPEGVAHDAIVDASAKYEGRNDAVFSTFAVKVFRNRALRILKRSPKLEAHDNHMDGVADENSAGQDDESGPPKPVSRLPRGSLAAAGRALQRYFDHEGMMVEGLMFGDSREVLPRHLRGSLEPQGGVTITMEGRKKRTIHSSPGLLAIALRDEGLPPWSVEFDADFDTKLLAYADQLLGVKDVTLPDGTVEKHWVEDDETLERNLAKVGRRRADPYERRHDKSLPRELREWWAEAKGRHAGMIFEEKRRDAALSIVRYAMKLAGISGRMLNRIESGVRAAEAKREAEERKRVLRVMAEAMSSQKTK